MTKGKCWIDGRETDVAPRLTIIGVKVDTCADGKGCDTPLDEPQTRNAEPDDVDEA